MRTHVSRAVLMASLVAAIAARAEEREPATATAWIDPAEIALDSGKLYFTAWAGELPAGAEVSFRLGGEGVSQALSRKAAPLGPFGPAKERGEALCVGVRPHGGSDLEAAVEYDARCSFDAAALHGGRTYTISVWSGDAKLASEDFQLRMEPAAGGRKLLQVDPLTRVDQLSYQQHGFVYWALVDARLSQGIVSVTWIRNGQAASTKTTMIGGPGLRHNPLIRTPTPLVLPAPQRNTIDIDAQPSTWRAVVLLNGDRVLTSFEVTDRKNASGVYAYGGVKEILYQGYGPLAPSQASADDVRVARAAAKTEISKLSRDIRDRVGSRSEPLVCALAVSQDAYTHFRTLKELSRESDSLIERYVVADRTLKSAFASADDKQAARKEKAATVSGVGRQASAAREIQEKLNRIALRQKAGCLQELFGAKLPSATVF